MNSLLDEQYNDPSGNDREVTLSTGTILGIFLGLVLLCGVFFGFGYKMGSSHTALVVAAPASNGVAPSTTNFSSFKPSAGSPVSNSPSAVVAAPVQHPAATIPTEETAAEPVAHASPAVAAHAAPESALVASGTILVQVAAFTHQEDADLLVHTLKGQGYSAFVRSEPQDKLLHIQVGPFINRRDAEATKQRLLADGYQPIVK